MSYHNSIPPINQIIESKDSPSSKKLGDNAAPTMHITINSKAYTVTVTFDNQNVASDSSAHLIGFRSTTRRKNSKKLIERYTSCQIGTINRVKGR